MRRGLCFILALTITVVAFGQRPGGPPPPPPPSLGSRADLAVRKEATTNTVACGDTIEYIIGVANRGAKAAEAVRLEDRLPAGLLYAEALNAHGVITYTTPTVQVRWPRIEPGTTEIVVLRVVAVGRGIVTNTASASTLTTDSVPMNNVSRFDVTIKPRVTPPPPPPPPPTVVGADLRVEKRASACRVRVGEAVTFALLVGNSGPSAAENVVLSDLMPAQFEFVSADGAAATIADRNISFALGTLDACTTRLVKLTAVATTVGLPLNVAAVSSDTTDPMQMNNVSRAGVAIESNEPPPPPPPPPPPAAKVADLSVAEVSTTSSATVGDTLSFDIVVKNNGPDQATTVGVVNQLDRGFELVSVEGAASATGPSCALVLGALDSGAERNVRVNVRVVAAGRLRSLVNVCSPTSDPVQTNNRAECVVNVEAPIKPPPPPPPTVTGADLRLVGAVSDRLTTVGQSVVFTFTATNAGPDQAEGVVIAAVLPTQFEPQGTDPADATTSGAEYIFALGSLARDASAVVKITAVVKEAGTFGCSARVSADTVDPVRQNNGAGAGVVAVPENATGPDLSGEWKLSTKPARRRGAAPTPVAQFVIKNIGDVPAGSSRMIVYLSADNQLDSSDRKMAQPNCPGVRPGESKNVSMNLAIPSDARGKYLIAVLDTANQVAESNETNNAVSVQLP